MTPEAMLLSALDDLEAKFQTLRGEFNTARASGKKPEEVTEWVRSMERPLFDSQAYLANDPVRINSAPQTAPLSAEEE
jgi:3'-5' exoribonuclease